MQVNPRYVPQLQSLLQWPQSAGIVGGRPSSSLYFVGFQGHQVIYLDPHEVQEVRLQRCLNCQQTKAACFLLVRRLRQGDLVSL